MFRGMLLRRFSGVGFLIGGLLLLACLVTALLLAPTGDAAGTQQGPVASYSFDEGTGTTVEDVTGDGNTATIEGAEWAPRGMYGGAMKFDASKEDRLSIPAAEDLDLTEEFTLEAWVHPESAAEEYAMIFGKENSVSPHFAYVVYAHTPYDAPEVFFDESAKAHLGGAGGTPSLHTWTHIALTDDGAHSRLYVDGKLVDTGEAVPIPSTDGDLVIGGNKSFSSFFDGKIDEVRVYNRALDEAEVQADAATPIQTTRKNPVADYSFDEDPGESTTIEDLSGNGHTATIEGATWSPHGRYGGAMSFDGEGQALSIPAAEDLDLTEEFTLEAWVHPESSPAIGNILEKENSGEPPYSYLLTDQHGQLGAHLQEEGAYTRYSPGEAVEPHVWTHVALTYDGARVHLFIDGQEVESGPAPSFVSTDGALIIGGGEALGGNSFDGRIDELRIYDRALNEGEVQADATTPIQTPLSGPLAAYSFDEGEVGTEGGTVEDVSEHEHTATLEGGAVRVKGRYGDGVHFREEGDCATVPDSPELRLSEEFTLEAWVWAEGGLYEDPVVVREAGGEGAFGIAIGSREEGEAEGFIGEGEGSKAAIGGGEVVREHTWVHIATTYDGAHLRLYVDGELVATKSATTPPLTGEGALRIGCDGPDGPFGGRIDEVRLYGRALNGGEVASDMETPLQTPKATPVASYSFDEDNEETQADTSGGGHTATVEGASWTEHGRYGGAMEFDASEEDVLKIPASPYLNFSEEFTLEAWVRPSGEGNVDAPLIDKQEGGGLGYFLYEGGSESDVPVGAADPGQEHVHAHEALPAHAWSHVALVFTGNRTHLYVNGEEVQDGAAEPLVGEEGELEIGGSSDTGDYFDGRIDEVRIYNRGLSAAEVAVDMEAPIQTPKQGPVAAYSFDEGTGATVKDLTGDGHTATIHGSKWSTHGKFGGAMQFEASKEAYLSVPDSSGFDFDQEFTLEAWVRPEGNGSYAPLIDKTTPGGPDQPYFLYESSGSADISGGGIDGGTEDEAKSVAEAPIPTKSWTHLALTFDGSALRLYVDGALVDEEIGGSPMTTSKGELQIGGDGSGNFFVGRIDEVRLYNRALSGIEIGQTENSTFPVTTTDAASEVASNEAMMTGSVEVNGPATEFYFEYGPTTSYGSLANGEEITGNGKAMEVEELAIDLAPETTYHYRLVAEGPFGTSYGEDNTFTTGERTISVEEEEEEEVEVEEESEVEPLSSPETSESSPPEPKSFFGLDWDGYLPSMLKPNAKSDDFAKIRESGSEFVRLRLYPGEPGLAKAFERAQEDGLKVLPYLSEGNVPTGGERTVLINTLVEAIKAYGPSTPYHTVYWEIGNEPNRPLADSKAHGLEKAENFAQYYEHVASEVYSLGYKNVRFILPGLYQYHTGVEGAISPFRFLNRMIHTFKREGHNSPSTELYAGISIHPYVFQVRDPKHPKKGIHAPQRGNSEDTSQVVAEVRRAIKTVHHADSSVPIWVTELGFPLESSAPQPGEHKVATVSEAEQANLVHATFSALAHGRKGLDVAHAFYYRIQDRNDSPAWPEHTGLLDANRSPHPSWKTFLKVIESN